MSILGSIGNAAGRITGAAVGGYGEWAPEKEKRDMAQDELRMKKLEQLKGLQQEQADREGARMVAQAMTSDNPEQALQQVVGQLPQNMSPQYAQAVQQMAMKMYERNNISGARVEELNIMNNNATAQANTRHGHKMTEIGARTQGQIDVAGMRNDQAPATTPPSYEEKIKAAQMNKYWAQDESGNWVMKAKPFEKLSPDEVAKQYKMWQDIYDKRFYEQSKRGNGLKVRTKPLGWQGQWPPDPDEWINKQMRGADEMGVDRNNDGIPDDMQGAGESTSQEWPMQWDFQGNAQIDNRITGAGGQQPQVTAQDTISTTPQQTQSVAPQPAQPDTVGTTPLLRMMIPKLQQQAQAQGKTLEQVMQEMGYSPELMKMILDTIQMDKGNS